MGRPIGRTLREVLGSWWFVVAVFCAALVLLVSVGRVFVRRASFQHEIAALQSEKERLISDNAQARRQLTYLSTEAFLEEEAREKFGQKRPGETVVYIAETRESVEAIDARVASNPELWWRYFFDPDWTEAGTGEDTGEDTDAAPVLDEVWNP